MAAYFTLTRLLAMDVDGVLTDGSLGYDNTGNEQKRFCVADGLGLTLMRLLGIRTAWISGRASVAVERRALELKIDHLVQGARDKGVALAQLAAQFDIKSQEIAFVGDDWNDLPAFEVAGTRIAVANAAEEVKARADLITTRIGGAGAIREVCDLLLIERNQQKEALKAYLALLQAEHTAGSGQ